MITELKLTKIDKCGLNLTINIKVNHNVMVASQTVQFFIGHKDNT